MKLTGAEVIVSTLERAGVEYVFGLCGHANLSMLDALEGSTITFVPVRNEQNAAHMADAYFRFSHKPGVVLTTIGPGLANAVTGVWEAAMDSSGVIVISGNVPTYMIGKDAFQELSLHSDASQAEIYRPFVKRAWRVAHADSIPFVMHRAFNLALAGRPGPVLVDVPIDLFSAVLDCEVPDVSEHLPSGSRIRGDRDEIERAVRLLAQAERPLIHAGNGCLLSKAGQELVALAEHLAIPVTTSMQSQGVIDKLHPLSGGYPGVVGTPTGNALAREADVVLAVGTRFSELETSSWDPEYSFRFAEEARLIQVDIDPHEIGRLYPVEVGIVGDAQAVLKEMTSIARDTAPARVWEEQEHIQILMSRAREWAEEKEDSIRESEHPISIQNVIHVLSEVMPQGSVLLADAGTFRHGVGQYFPIRESQTWFIPSGLGTMGGAAPAALGAKLARPDSAVVCLIGDGGMSANDHALATAVEQNIPVVWVVLNNFAWDSIRVYQQLHYDGRVLGTELSDREGRPYNPDFVKVAEGYSVEATRVEDGADLRTALERALNANRPYLVEVIVGPTRLKATGHWDVADILKAEGQFKRDRELQRAQPSRQAS